MTMTQEKPLTTGVVQRVKLGWVKNNPWQPRTSMDQDEVRNLADSIKSIGLLQLPTVRPVPLADGKVSYELAYGHRRMAALRVLELEEHDLVVRELSDAEMAIIALTENVQRKDLTPIETYRAWAKALQIDGLSVVELASKLGLDRSTVSNNLRLLRLPQHILAHVESGEMSAHAAREFLCLLGGPSDGPGAHFHGEIATPVLRELTTGTPDWRVARVRYLITHQVASSSVNDWRKLTKGYVGGGHQADPLFDVAKFKQDKAGDIHSIPSDDWGGYSPSTGKVAKEESRDWTCATSTWVARQNAAKNTAAAVAAVGVAKAGDSAVASAPALKSGSFKTQLSRDPVFMAVSQETEGTLLKSLWKDGEMGDEISERLGTRATPVEIGKAGFKAAIDEQKPRADGLGATELPSYFPNIGECRKTCTWGATYGAVNHAGPLYLWCLNKEHFEEKVEAGRKVVMGKVERQEAAANEADDKVLGVLAERAQHDKIAHLAAAALLLSARFERMEPDNVDYRERDDLSVWTSNVRRIFELLDATPASWTSKALLAKLGALGEEEAGELLLRLLTERVHDEALAQFVPAAAAEASK